MAQRWQIVLAHRILQNIHAEVGEVHAAWREGATPYYDLRFNPDDVLRDFCKTSSKG